MTKVELTVNFCDLQGIYPNKRIYSVKFDLLCIPSDEGKGKANSEKGLFLILTENTSICSPACSDKFLKGLHLCSWLILLTHDLSHIAICFASHIFN